MTALRGTLPATRIRSLAMPAAVAALIATIAGILLLLAVASGSPAPPEPTVAEGSGDLAMYARLVERLRAGEEYYAAAHAELLAGDFGTRSVFNWRTPAYFSLLALAPSLMWAQAGLALLALAAAAAALLLFRRTGGDTFALLLAPFLLLGLTSVIVPTAVLLPEVAAGLLILLSVAAYGLGRSGVGLTAGAAALAVRELAAPYALICAWLAWREGRRREVVAWLAVFVAYAAYFGWHASQVAGALEPADRAYPDGWLQWGGLDFILATAAFNGTWGVLPFWATAIALPLSLLGLAAWLGPGGTRAGLAVAAYLLLFSAFGKPFNYYWGAMYTPLLALGMPWAIAAIRDLGERVRPAANLQGE